MLLNIYKNKFIFMYIIRYMWNYQQSFAILFVIQCSYSTNYKILVRIIAIWLRTSVKHSVKIFFFFLSLSFFRSLINGFAESGIYGKVESITREYGDLVRKVYMPFTAGSSFRRNERKRACIGTHEAWYTW